MTDGTDILERISYAITTASNDDLSEVGTEKRARHVGRMDIFCDAAEEIKTLRAQLPEGMKECAIVYEECAKGHGRLRATNWVTSDCEQCHNEKVSDALQAAASYIESMQFCINSERLGRAGYLPPEVMAERYREAVPKPTAADILSSLSEVQKATIIAALEQAAADIKEGVAAGIMVGTPLAPHIQQIGDQFADLKEKLLRCWT